MKAVFLLTALAVAMIFGGCVATQQPAAVGNTSSAPPTASAPEFSDQTGAIHGAIINEEGSPVAGATVGVMNDASKVATSALTGEYTLSDLAPGTHTVSVAALGFKSAAKQVNVAAGEVAQANFQLVAIAVKKPYYVTMQQSGNIQCSVTAFPGAPLTGIEPDGWYSSVQACGIVSPPGLAPSKYVLVFNASAGTKEVLTEMVWSSTQVAGSGLSFVAEDPNGVNSGPTYGTAAGASPLRAYADAAHVLNVTGAHSIDPTNDSFQIQTRTFSTANTTNQALPVPIPELPVFGAPRNQKVDAGLALDQTFTVYVTTFVDMTMPQGFSALADR